MQKQNKTKPRTEACEDRSNRGSKRPRNGAAEGCTNEQDEHRSGQVPKTSAVEDQIARIGAGEGSDLRGSDLRGSEPRSSIPGGPSVGDRSEDAEQSIRAAKHPSKQTNAKSEHPSQTDMIAKLLYEHTREQT